jgi:hypothetical protein
MRGVGSFLFDFKGQHYKQFSFVEQLGNNCLITKKAFL